MSPIDERVVITSDADVAACRVTVHDLAGRAGLRRLEVTRLVVAASELARNALEHGGGGTMTASLVDDGSRRAVKLVFHDQGPGIADIDLALRNGYSSAGGLGLGLGGARRLVDDLVIESAAGRGTTVTVTEWLGSPILGR